MDSLGALLDQQEDFEPICAWIASVDLSNVSTLKALFDHRKLGHRLINSFHTILISNAANQQSLDVIMQSLECLGRVPEFRHLLRADQEIACLLEAVFEAYPEFIMRCSNVIDELNFKSAKFVNNVYEMTIKYGIRTVCSFHEMSADQQKSLVKIALANLDSPSFYSSLSLIIEAREIATADKFFRLALSEVRSNPCHREAAKLICAVMRHYRMDEKSVMLFLSLTFKLLLSFSTKSDYSVEIRQVLQNLGRWAHGVGFESVYYSYLLSECIEVSPECMIAEAFLGCLSVPENECLYNVDHRLYEGKVFSIIDHKGYSLIPFKSLIVTITHFQRPFNSLTAFIARMILDLIIRFHKEAYLHYESEFVPIWDEFRKISRPSTPTKTFVIKRQFAIERDNGEYLKKLESSFQTINQLQVELSEARKSHQEQAMLAAELANKNKVYCDEITSILNNQTSMKLEIKQLKEQVLLEEKGNQEKCLLVDSLRMSAREQMSGLQVIVDEQKKEMENLKVSLISMQNELNAEKSRHAEEKKLIALQFVEFKRRSLQEKACLSDEINVLKAKLEQVAGEFSKLEKDYGDAKTTIGRLEQVGFVDIAAKDEIHELLDLFEEDDFVSI